MFELNHALETTSILYIAPIVILIGLRHGFDLDHLATIDAITRVTSNNSNISRSVGLLFSLGHGTVIIIMSMVINGKLLQFQPSHALDLFGKLVSIAFLFIFGFTNIYNVLFYKKSRGKEKIINWASRYLANKHYQAVFIFIVGVLFAISFDTFSQIALLTLSAASRESWLFAFFIGVLFMLGMIIADGLNGFLVAQAISRGNKISITISRLIGLSIALFSLTVGVIGLVQLVSD